MTLLKHNYFRYQMFILRFLGLWPYYEVEVSSLVHYLYAVYSIIMRCIYVIHTSLETIELVYLITDLDHFTECLIYCMQHLAGIVKIIAVVANTKTLRWLINETEKEPLQRPYQEEFQKEASVVRKQAKAAELTFILLCVGIATMALTDAIFNRKEIVVPFDPEFNDTLFDNLTKIVKYERHFPTHLWYPSSIDQTSSPNYEILFLTQIIGLFVVASTVVAIDMAFLHFIMHVTFHFRCLQRELRNVRQESIDAVMIRHDSVGLYESKKLYRNERIEREITTEMVAKLKNLVKYHEKILEFASALEDSCSWIFFIQLFSTLLCTASVLFILSTSEVGSARFYGMLFLLPALFVQIFMNCWFGNELMLESSGIYNAVYDCSWEQINHEGGYGEVKPYLSAMMTKALSPTVLTAKKFTALTLDVFVAVVKASYSCYTVLKQSDE